MRNWLKLALPLAIVCLLVGVSSQASAASVSGRSSTVLEWYDNADGESALPIHEYLTLNVRDIADQGWTFYLYGRLSNDFTDNVEADSRLYTAYLEKRDLVDDLDMKLGRQFIASTAGASVLDGLYLDYAVGTFDVVFFSGIKATFDDTYYYDNWVLGGEISSRFLQRMTVALSFFNEWDNGYLANSFYGLDFDYSFDRVDLYSETRYSWMTEEVTYFLVGSGIRTDSPLFFRVEYLYSLPVFSSTSIYSVFAVDEYRELMGEASYWFRRGLRGFASVTRELYESTDDATVIEAGIEQNRILNFSGYLIASFRNDPDGQDMRGIKAHAAYLFTPKFEAGAGAHIDVLERQIKFPLEGTSVEAADDTSRRFWLDATAYLTPTINLQGKVEFLKSAVWDEYYKGRVRLNVLF